jgi:hypothetical protein
VIGVIGGYQEGGSTSSASYADVPGANVAGLYKAAAPGLNRGRRVASPDQGFAAAVIS